jgi:hypothetical protein
MTKSFSLFGIPDRDAPAKRVKGPDHLVRVKINITQPAAWHARHLRLNAASLAKLFHFVETKLKEGRIRRSAALNACTPMLVPKPDGGSERLVIDFTPLNKVSSAIQHTGPRLEDVLQRASECKYFSKLDIKDAFWSLGLAEESKYLTAFSTPWGTFEYNCLPQGWCNAPAYWQCYASYILRDLIFVCCFAMADDILVFGSTQQECHVRTRQVRSLIRRAGLEENQSKSLVAHTSVTFFGVTLQHNRWRPVQNKDTLANWKVPRNKKALQQWLGTINVFRDHIPNLSKIVQPLTHLTGDHKWEWGATHTQSFQQSKDACLQQMWRHSHVAGAIQELIIDASDRGIGAILKETGRIVAIISRQLTYHETQYDTKHRECLGAVWATKKLVHIVSDAPTLIIHTDHANLVTSLRASETSGRVNRWIDWLSNFPISWRHVKGANNPADGPSRQWDHAS